MPVRNNHSVGAGRSANETTCRHPVCGGAAIVTSVVTGRTSGTAGVTLSSAVTIGNSRNAAL